jgi:uncharacterized OB-fold protein
VSWSTVHRSPLPDVAGPYVVVIVELTEGPWLLLRLLDATDGTDGRLRLDQDVELVALPSGTDPEHAGETLFAARITGTRQ